VTGQLGGYAQLGAVYVTAAMPKTRTGKTMRRVLRDVVMHGAPQGDVSVMEDPSALDVVIAAVRAAGA
jgi:acetyl-CoA synthetase